MAEPKQTYVLPVMIIGTIVAAALLAFSLRRMSTRQTVTQSPQATATAAQGEPHNAELDRVPRIKPDELRDLIARDKVTVIDVRDTESFASGHIPGSLHIPLARIDGEIANLPKDKPIVTYCT